MLCTTWLSLLLIATVFIIEISSDKTNAGVYDNREIKSEVTAIKRPSFFVGSRYGRSQFYGSNKGLSNLNVVPRNDRFFLGSRYGKRADEFMQDVIDQEPSRNLSTDFMYMTCVYTGVKDFYRCYKGLENNIEQNVYSSKEKI